MFNFNFYLLMKWKNPSFKYCENVPTSHVYPVEQPVYVSEQVNVEGRLISRQVVKTIDRREQEKGNKVTDFCLENQIAIGSSVLGSSVCYGADNTDNILNAASAAVANMDAAAAAANKQQNDKQDE